jgi:hypothetical protein
MLPPSPAGHPRTVIRSDPSSSMEVCCDCVKKQVSSRTAPSRAMTCPNSVKILEAISEARKAGPICLAAERLRCTEVVRNLHAENVVGLVRSMNRAGWKDSEPAYGVVSHERIPALSLFDIIAGNHRTTAAQILMLDVTYVLELKLESSFVKEHLSDTAIALQLWEPSPRPLSLMDQVHMIFVARMALEYSVEESGA